MDKKTPLRHISNRELFARLYACRAAASANDEERAELAALEAEWQLRLDELRGPSKKGRISRRRERAAARFLEEARGYFHGCADRDRLWCERARLLAERVAKIEKDNAELLATLERFSKALNAAASSPTTTPLTAKDRAALAWGLDARGPDARGRSKGEPS